MRNGRNHGAGGDADRDGRREPRFDLGTGRRGEIHISPEDRTAGPRPKASAPRRGERIEPAFASITPKIVDDGPMSGRKRAFRDPERKSRPKRRRRSLIGRAISWCLVLGVWGLVAMAGLVAFYARELPPIDQLAVPKRPPNIAIQGEDGTVLANRGDTGGAAVKLGDLPPYLPKAFVAIEDRRFYSHYGIDPFGIARALTRNVVGGSGMQGGSTLTQQLAKNLFLTQERTVSRKIQEAILALWLEHKYSKNQILELYLNRVYFGSGAYGVEAAAQKYFGKGARQVTLAEAAMLAGLMKAPTKLAPNRNPVGATDRAAQVIAAMADEKFVTDAAAKQALASPARAVKERDGGAIGYAADYVMDVLDDTIGAIDSDIVVTTTISPVMERAGEQALVEELNAKGGRYGVSEGALVALDPNGAIKALVGGRNYADSQFDRAVAAKRQPGSSFKPFVYLTALEHGLTPDTVRDDAPINVKGWQPENYSHEYFGPVTLTQALSLSLNTVAVRLGVEVGPKAIVATAHRLGITSDLQSNASIALGTSEVSPLELAGAYAPFANGGFGVQTHIITSVKTTDGKLLYQRKATGFGRVIDPAYVTMMNTMMQETLLTGTARKAELPGWQAAGKTGTSQDWRDAWFVGYTGALVADVWLGNDDSSPTKKASGGNLPVDIWSRFMRAALKNAAPVPLPGNVPPSPAPDDGAMAGLPARDPATGHAAAAPPTTLGQLISSAFNPATVTPAPQRAPLPPGAPMPINPAGQVIANARAGVPHRDPNALLPPASIPAQQADGAPDDRNLLQRLFGG